MMNCIWLILSLIHWGLLNNPYTIPISYEDPGLVPTSTKGNQPSSEPVTKFIDSYACQDGGHLQNLTLAGFVNLLSIMKFNVI